MNVCSKKIALATALLLASSLIPISAQTGGKDYEEAAAELVKSYLKDGKQIFRFDTFG